jgi:WD40 repeat protein
VTSDLGRQGLAALSADVGSCLLAIPGRQPGHIQLVQLSPTSVTGTANSNTASASDSHPHAAFRSPIINAHSHTLSSLACSSDGKYLVSSSERGSIFRVWNVATGSLERELRRGVDKAVIWGVDLVYRPANAEKKLGRELWMVCWSDKGTVHVWGDVLGENKPTAAQTEAAKKNQR